MSSYLLHLPLVFHFNQHLNEHGRPASLTCYRGLLHVLRSHPNLHFNIHISGTLIHALQWLDPEPLQLIRDGLADGQFELLGSTYSQNVPYATDDWDNARQIELHQQTIHNAFAVTPTAFWNSERCWRQSLVPIIAQAGYRLTLVEDHILDAAGSTNAAVITTHYENHSLTIIRDDETLKHKFNFAAYFGRPNQLETYLASAQQAGLAAGLTNPCLAYAEDAEALGLWGWRPGVVPNQTWYRLDQLLSRLQNHPNLQLTHLSAALNLQSPISNLLIPDGAAAWMQAALHREDAPYHEDGYANWFDFNTRSPRLAHYRQLYDRIRKEIRDWRLKDKQSPISNLQSLALHNYLVHQYEFGCIGIGSAGFRGWEGVKASLVLLRLAELAQTDRPFSLIEDPTGEDKSLIFLGNGPHAIVLTPYGGRILYWLDLTTGRQWLGNQLAVPFARYESEGQLPEMPLRPRFWTPDDFSPQPTMPGAELVEEAAPTRLGRYLPPSVWPGEPEPFTLLVRDMQLAGTQPTLPAQRRGLVDFITLDDQLEADAGAWLSFNLNPASQTVTFNRPLSATISLEKSITLAEHSIVARYTFHNQDTAVHTFHLRLLNELCPDYTEVVRHGRPALSAAQIEGYPAVQNTITGATISVRPDHPWQSVTYNEALLALELELSFNFELEPDSVHTLIIQLEVKSHQP